MLECLRAIIRNRITAKALPSTAQHCPLFHVHLTSIVLAKVVIGLLLAVGPKGFVATDCLSIRQCYTDSFMASKKIASAVKNKAKL